MLYQLPKSNGQGFNFFLSAKKELQVTVQIFKFLNPGKYIQHAKKLRLLKQWYSIWWVMTH